MKRGAEAVTNVKIRTDWKMTHHIWTDVGHTAFFVLATLMLLISLFYIQAGVILSTVLTFSHTISWEWCNIVSSDAQLQPDKRKHHQLF